jgi:cobalt-zinc-cadmium efflux system membrane fusion protein
MKIFPLGMNKILFYPKLIISLLVLCSIQTPYAKICEDERSGCNQEISVKGPHGGRLLIKDDMSVEVTMFERGMPPHFRVFLYKDNKLLVSKNANLTIQLQRFSGKTEDITFIPIEDFLQSVQVIKEPHSFDVKVSLQYQDNKISWDYPSYEGRVTIPPKLAAAAGIKVKVAGAKRLEKKITIMGKITPNWDTLTPVYPRYPGIIKTMAKNLGESVKKDETLVFIERNTSLKNYSILSPVDGTIIRKHVDPGELAKGDKPIYEIANLDTVWADINLYRKITSLVKKGMKVIVTGDEGKPTSNSTISYISPLGVEDSQTVLARAIISNKNQEWFPGMFIDASIILGEMQSKVAVPRSALQHWRDWNVVFVKKGNQYEAAIVELGEQDENWVEILSGLEPGQAYVAENSFFIKADIEKSGASHDH